MRVTSLLALGAAAIVLLVGCTSAPVEAQKPTQRENAAPSAEPAPTPTIDVGPVELNTEQAGERYLNLMCQRNDAVYKVNDAFQAKADEYLNGGDPDPTEVKKAAAEAMRVSRVTVELIDDPYYVWPDGTGELLQTLKGSLLGDAGYYSAVANATSFDAANNVSAPSIDVGSAPQELRYKLGLPADTTTSCKGLETAADPLHAEMQQRNEYLASFSEEE